MTSRSLRLPAVLLFYLALAVVATWPLARDAADHVYGAAEGTPPLNIWAMGWVLHQLPRAPLALFEGNAFYPHHNSLAFSEHLFVPSLMSAPIVAATGNLVLGYNLVEILTLALAGLGMFLLARELTGDEPASFIAGMLYAFHTWNINELVRNQILSNQWFPYVLLACVQFFRRPTQRGAAFVALTFVLQTLSCMYWALYVPILLGTAVVALQWRYRLAFAGLRRLVLPLAVAAIVVGPFWWPYIENARVYGFARPVPDSISIGRYFDVLRGNWLYSWLGTARGNQDAAHFLGFASLALGAVGFWRGRWASDGTPAIPRAYLASLVVFGCLLSLGPEIRLGDRTIPGPYSFVYEWIPGFKSVRYPERFSIFVVLGLAPFVASGISALRGLLDASPLRSIATAAVGALVFVEHLSTPLFLYPMPPVADLPAVYQWLKREPRVSVVAEVPAERHLLERFDCIPMYNSTAHWKPTIQGFTGYFPPAYDYIRWRMFHFPDPATLRFLEKVGVDAVVIRPDAAPFDESAVGPDRTIEGPFPAGHRVLLLPRGRGQTFPSYSGDDASLAEIPRDRWVVRSSHDGAERLRDADPSSAWTTGDYQRRGDYIRVRFREEVLLSRVSLALPPPYAFPMRLRLTGESQGGERTALPFDEEKAYDRLFSLLLYEPRSAQLMIDLVNPARVVGVRVEIASTDPFRLPWTIGDVRVYEPTVKYATPN